MESPNENRQVGQVAQIVKDYHVVNGRFWTPAIGFLAGLVGALTVLIMTKGI